MSHENSPAKQVFVQRPTIATAFGSIHPRGSLFEAGVNNEDADRDHTLLVDALKRCGVEVFSLEDLMNEVSAEDLRLLAMQLVRYRPAPGSTFEPDEECLSDKYKWEALSAMDKKTLMTLIFCPCEVLLTKSDKNTHVEALIQMRPLCNLIFTRDQQINTIKGTIIANMSPPQRAQEPQIIKYLFEKTGRKVLGTLPEDCKLEGGDFYPMGKELCFIGCGLRTNDKAIHYMLEQDWFGTQRVAVIRDLYDQNQNRMHLDTVFNVVNEDHVVLLESLMTDASRRREVTEYVRGTNGKYSVHLTMEFSQYLQKSGYKIIPVSDAIQANYGINFLNVGQGRILLLNKEMEEILQKELPGKIETIFVPFKAVNAMYGGIHCATQVFRQDVPSKKGKTEEQNTPPKKNLRRTRSAMDMDMGPAQTTNKVLMIAPTAFGFNIETANDNYFMNNSIDLRTQRTQLLTQYADLVETLRQHGVEVSVFNHEPHHGTPDACFPNNWFSTHFVDGRRVCMLYPMKAETRRKERREDIIQYLRNLGYEINNRLLAFENGPEPAFLEGTGSLVLNRETRTAYCVISERSHEKVAKAWAEQMQYNLVLFHAVDKLGKPVYHTNVVLSVGASIAVFCEQAVLDLNERKAVLESLEKSNKKLIKITLDQMEQFCGNVLELSTSNAQNIVVMSNTAFGAFSEEQRLAMEENCRIVHADISVLETLGGGSARCCIAELF